MLIKSDEESVLQNLDVVPDWFGELRASAPLRNSASFRHVENALAPAP